VVAPGASDLRVWAPEALLRAFLDAVVDALLRSTKGAPTLRAKPANLRSRAQDRASTQAAPDERWEQRFSAALTGADDSFSVSGFGERSVVDELARWSEPAVGSRDRLRAYFRLELPEHDHDSFVLRFLLQSPDDPSLHVPAADVWSGNAQTSHCSGARSETQQSRCCSHSVARPGCIRPSNKRCANASRR
jgi:Tfp pilus assembly protein PilV